jgi:uncharacterized protein (DUF58 family)
MRFTRRFRALAALAVLLAGYGALVGAVAPLVGGAALGALLFARGYAFLDSLRTTRRNLSVVTTLAPERTVKGRSVTAGLAARLDASGDLPLRIEPDPPAGVEGSVPELRLAPGETDAEASAELTPALAGRHRFGRPTVHAESADGLFAESLPAGEEAALTAEARAASGVHLGAGGEQVAAAYGEHPGGEGGSGLTPAELREYVPGDPAGRIDWKATARLSEAHVREFESETDRRTVLLLDHRSTTGRGEGTTALDCLREVALAVVGAAEAWTDPLGFYAVGEAGLTAEFAPATAPDHYDAVGERLRGLAPTAAPAERGPERADADPAAANRRAAALAGGDDAFSRTLRPYFGATERYVRRVEGDPLFAAAKRVGRLNGRRWTVLLTDDSERGAVRETVKYLRRNGNHVLCVLAPTALFDAGGLADPAGAYRDYADFEAFRTDLASLARVQALEVAPEDRLEAALAGRGARA